MVLLWQVLEHLPKPTVVLNEVTRVLKPNGQVYGSVSCLEPFHDICSYYGFTHKGIEQILTDCGFTDIEIQPGINAFSLITRSWLRHLLVPSKVVEWSCFFLVRALFIPSLWLYLFSRKLLNLLRRGKLGTDYKSTVKWLSEDAPLEFAGHLMFKARKAG